MAELSLLFQSAYSQATHQFDSIPDNAPGISASQADLGMRRWLVVWRELPEPLLLPSLRAG